MTLEAGKKLGPYEIQSLLGEGGMGEVYRARDTRLERTVAIKILPKEMSADATRKQRFEREAKTISSLNHPHICVLHDIGSQDGVDYLVMECVEGESLAKRLEKGPLPLDQVLKIGSQIADALDKAHRAGIVHRDLKPGNIMLTPTGAKLLDFGLAKLAAPLVSGMTLTAAATPTPTTPVTQEGTIVGTFQYMSPEQIEGKEVDGRSDIFSLGAVLYEMVTGQKAFQGKSQLSVASAILEKEPTPISSIKPLTPPAMDHAIRRCLGKDPEERWQSARDLGGELKWIAETKPSAEATPGEDGRRTHGAWLAWSVAATCALGALLLAIALLHSSPQPGRMIRSSLLPPAATSFLPYNFAIAPDGSRLAFVALDQTGRTSLWVRGLSSTTAQQLADTEGATYPFWAPDSTHIGFFSQGRLKSVDLLNSEVKVVCEAQAGFGGTWNRDGTIVFAPGITGPLYRVKATGGTPQAVTKLAPGTSETHHWPYFLPDGKHVLYYLNWGEGKDGQVRGVYAASLEDGTSKLISPEITGNVLFAGDHLLYVRGRTILAQPFDAKGLRTTGPAVPLTQTEVDKFFDFWQSGFSVSQEGKLVFQSTTEALAGLVWYDQSGKELGQFAEAGYDGPQFSPDGRYLAVYADDEHNGKHFIRTYDLQRGISRRLTEGGDESNPVWSRDGKRIAYRGSSLNIEVIPADGSGPSRLLVKGTNVIPCDWSADGHLIYMSVGAAPFPSLEVYSEKDQKTTTLVKAGAEPQFSPDGNWVAYIEVPSRQIVVQPFPGPGTPIQMSRMPGSSQPRWSRDGKRIYFVQPNRKIMMVAFDPNEQTASPPQQIAETRITVTVYGWIQYDVSPDGRLLVNSLPTKNAWPMTLMENWEAELKEK